MVLLPAIWWFNKAAQNLKVIGPVLTSILAFLAWWFNIIEVVVVGALLLITATLNSLDLSAFSGATFGAFTVMGYVNAVFPLSEALGIASAYVAAWTSVITVRWIKSFVPTLAN